MLYTQIIGVYDNLTAQYTNIPKNLTQFMKLIKYSLSKDKDEDLFSEDYFPQMFRDFYFKFFDLINPSPRKERDLIIKSSLNNVISLVITKYDYYFTNHKIDNINVPLNYINDFLSCEHFILVGDDTRLMILNTQTNEAKIFPLPDNHKHPFYIQKCILFEEIKIAITRNIVHNDGTIFSAVLVIDFDTQKQQYHKIEDQLEINDIKISQLGIILAVTDNGIFILDKDTLEVKNRLPTIPAAILAIYKDDSQFISSINRITFWNEKTVTINFTEQYIIDMQFLSNKEKFVVMTYRSIGICDFKTKSVIKTINLLGEGINSYFTEMIISKEHIIVRTEQVIYFYDYDLNLQSKIGPLSEIFSMSLLLNDHLVIVLEKSLSIWDIERKIFVTTEIKGQNVIVINGRIYKGDNDTITVYE